MTRRGYAMPMVVLLSLVAGLMVAVMVERQSAQRLTSERRIDGYRDHHAERGVRELADTWLKSITVNALAELVEDGEKHLLDIGLDDERTLSLHVSEAQGGILADTRGLSEQDLREARSILRAAGASEVERRAIGPVAISGRSAGEDAIRAVALAVIDNEDLADQFVGEFLRHRRRQLTDGSVASVANTIGVESDQRVMLARLIVATPSLFRVRAELTGGSREVSYEGFALLGPGSARSGRVSRDSSFLSWSRTDLDDNQQ